jgi:hypothetical protein
MKKIYLTIAIMLVMVTLSVYGCTSPIPQPSQIPQSIQYTMLAGSVAGSSVSYTKMLNAGDTISGYAELTGTNYGVDWSYTWTFQILGPGGESIIDWQGHYVNSPHKDFNTTASYSGIYTIRVSHVSTYPKNLAIRVSPPGWGYASARAPTTTTHPPSITVSRPPTATTTPTTVATAQPNQTIPPGTYLAFPSNGAYIQVNGIKTLIMSWSADGGLDCFILTETQYSNFKNSFIGYVSASVASGSGSSGTITAVVQNTDTYYVVVRNTFALGSPIKLYQAVLTEQ